MNEELFIHIGLHNTGTSWLQKEFFPYIPKMILSDENFSGNPLVYTNVEYRYILLNGIYKTYPNAKIIIGLRKDWKKSIYRHYIKRGGTQSFNNWKFDNNLLNFDEYINKINDLFNYSFVYWYEDFKNNKEKVLTDMCNFINIDIPFYEDKVINKGWYNKKISIGLFINKIHGKIRFIIDAI